MNQKFDLVIIGAGCVGMAAAYYALKMNRTVCLIQKNVIGDEKKFRSQSFVARQNRIQHNDQYLTKFIRASNDQWKNLQQELGKGKPFLYKEGTLWLGDKNVNISQGNIKAANDTIKMINSNLQPGEKKLQSLYMEAIMQESPQYMRAFKPTKPNEWDSWSALYQPDGGSIDMKASYDAFHLYIKSHGDKAVIYDNTQVVKHQCGKSEFKHKFITSSKKTVEGKSVFICTGIYTPQFLKEVMDYPHLMDNNFKEGESNRQYRIQQYVASYMKIDQGYQNFYSHFPSFINFIKENRNELDFSTFGFPYHNWDTMKTGHFITLGTMACKRFESLQQQTKYLKSNRSHDVTQDDQRVQALENYVMKRMNGVNAKHPLNKHCAYPMIFYEGRQTLLDYLQRKDQSIVVHSGGWVVNEYPLLAKIAVQMLIEPVNIKKQRHEQTIIGNFLNRTRFPIKPYVNDRLNSLNFNYPKNGEFKTAIIGAGCSGIYSAFRLNKSNNDGVGVFDLSERISGGLKSFEIRGTSTPLELEQMKYIPDRHCLLNEVVKNLGVPNISYPIEGQRLQTIMKKSSLKNEHYRTISWQSKRKMDSMMPTYKLKGHLLGMSAYQIISFSLYQILTAPQNVSLLTEIFLQKTKEEIAMQKDKAASQCQIVHVEDVYYRDWRNYIYREKDSLICHINLTLQQWNRLRQILVFRFPYQVMERDMYQRQQMVEMNQLYPLYKFGFQNVLEAQFGHQAYQFVAEQNGYYSHTSNASYLDQVMVYLLDFGDVTYRSISGGFDNINYAMANELLDEQKGLHNKNGGIYLGHKLVNIQKVNNRYLLTFHVKNENTPVPMQDPFKCQLLSGVKKSKLYNLLHKDLGMPIALPDKSGYSSIQFMAEKLILGMPKKAIQILYNQIDLLQQPITTYEQYYKSDRRHYESMFHFKNLKQEMNNTKKFTPLSHTENEQEEKLLRKQEAYYRDPTNVQQLSEHEVKKLNQYAERQFYDMLTKCNVNLKTEQQKIKRFTEDQPISPKTLFQLTQTVQTMPAMKMIMNFSKSWWDPMERINQSYKQSSKFKNLSKTAQELRGVSANDLSVRQTMKVSLGQDNILLCTYNDRITTEFWMALHKNFEKLWAPKLQVQKEMNSKQIITYPPNQNIFPAKEVLVKEALKELSCIHNMQVKEEWLKECAYQFWGNDHFGAGCHHFYSGYYVPSIMQCMRRPWKDQSIHFVGQTYSNTSGWVEGAFQTTEMLLQKEFGLTLFVKGYYAGY